ncbi:MAG: transglutaminase domain-containing protein, partial [Microbacterium sp.]|nr:transglutaminase domain-containing protein [Microbacterium sp.]
MNRTVSSQLMLDITEPAELVFAIAVSPAHEVGDERLTARIDGRDLPITEYTDVHDTRLHRVEAPIGRLAVEYQAAVGAGAPARVTEVDRFTYLRPSRYAESDALAATAAAEFGGLDDPAQLLVAVSSWVGTRLRYLSGSSRPTDGAVSTLLAREGVCRDFAHLATALLRARGVAARTVAVYAPGLDPMDFHAVVEADIDGV